MTGTNDIYERLKAGAERIETPFVDGNGRLVWWCWGEGPTLLMLHGDYGSWTHFIRNIDALSERYRLIIPDMPGYASSDLPLLDDIVVDSSQLLCDHLDTIIGPNENYDIVGFSFGGIYAGKMATIHKDRIGTVVLIGSGGMGVDEAPHTRREMQRMSRDMDYETRAAIHHNNLCGVMFARDETADDLAILLQDENTGRTRIRARGIPESDVLFRAFPDCTARFTAIWGERDAYAIDAVPEREQMLRNFFRDLDFRTIRGTGHWVMYEAPDAFNEIVLEMLG